MNKPIRIFLTMESKILAMSIRQIYNSPGHQEFVSAVSEADFIIFDSFELVREGFDESKPYACMTGIAGIKYPADMPENVTRITFADALSQLAKFFSK